MSFATCRTMSMVEMLESRRMLSVTLAPDPHVDENGVMQVYGTRHRDVIVMSVSDSGVFTVTVNGVGTSCDASVLTGVVVHGGSGHDVIRVNQEQVPFNIPVT